jgi:hypothetical protein
MDVWSVYKKKSGSISEKFLYSAILNNDFRQ